MFLTAALDTVKHNPSHSVYARSGHGVSFDLSYFAGRWDITVMFDSYAPITKRCRTAGAVTQVIERYAKTETLRWS